MHIFLFREIPEKGRRTAMEFIVLAPDEQRASHLSKDYLEAEGGPKTVLWRKVGLEHFGGAERAAVKEALGISREGLVTCDLQGRWSFLTPLGAWDGAHADKG